MNDIHKSIIEDNFDRFHELLRLPNADVNFQDESGTTPLLLCLKYRRTELFIRHLLRKDADAMIPDHDGVTPIGFSILYCQHYVFKMLLEYSSGNRDLTSKSEKLCEIAKSHTFSFKTHLIERGQNAGNVLVCCVNSFRANNVCIQNLEIFVNNIANVGKNRFNSICVELIVQAMEFSIPTMFESVWKIADHIYVTETLPVFMRTYLKKCRFRNPEFLKCFNLIMSSPQSLSFLPAPHVILINPTFLQELIVALRVRNMDKENRLSAVSNIAKSVDVMFDDINGAYKVFGFNEEVVLLILLYNPEVLSSRLNDYLSVVELVLNLDNDNRFSVENIDNLRLTTRMAYRKLINMLPRDLKNTFKISDQKELILNRVPKLFDLSTYSFQKYLQDMYRTRTSNEFIKLVERFNLPASVQNAICDEPLIHLLVA